MSFGGFQLDKKKMEMEKVETNRGIVCESVYIRIDLVFFEFVYVHWMC